jgi:hypothetical protein
MGTWHGCKFSCLETHDPLWTFRFGFGSNISRFSVLGFSKENPKELWFQIGFGSNYLHISPKLNFF